MRRWLPRTAVGALLVLVALTIASLAYNAATGGRDEPGTALYRGPFVRVDGTLVAYRRWGSSGSPIVLVGGFVEPSWVWREVGPLLARRHRVFALDLPPFGYTERRGPYTLAGWIDLLRGFEVRLGIRRPLVVGHSLGAAVAVADALARPAEVSGIVLLDGDALASGGSGGWLSHLLVDPFYTSLFRIVTGSDWIVRRALQEAYGTHAPKLDHAVLEQWERPFRVTGTAPAFHALLGRGIQGFHLDDLRRVHVRRLVVWGAEDTVDPVSAGRATAAVLQAPFVLVPGAGHLSMLAGARGVARAVERLAARP